jgi:hypothetical protein
VVDAGLLDGDPHFAQGCAFCHRGEEAAQQKEAAHRGLRKRPSDDPALCGQ